LQLALTLLGGKECQVPSPPFLTTRVVAHEVGGYSKQPGALVLNILLPEGAEERLLCDLLGPVAITEPSREVPHERCVILVEQSFHLPGAFETVRPVGGTRRGECMNVMLAHAPMIPGCRPGVSLPTGQSAGPMISARLCMESPPDAETRRSARLAQGADAHAPAPSPCTPRALPARPARRLRYPAATRPRSPGPRRSEGRRAGE